MKLYQFAYSPFVAKVRKCLEWKGLAYQPVEVPYLDRRELVEVSGGVMVPVLVDGTTVVRDSARITAYLDERHAPSLRPGPLRGPATALERWADEVVEEIAFKLAAPGLEHHVARVNGRVDAGPMFRLVKERRYGAGCLDAWRAAEPELAARLADELAPTAATLAEQPFLLGDRPTVADAALYGMFVMMEFGCPGRAFQILPGLAAWYRRVDEARARL